MNLPVDCDIEWRLIGNIDDDSIAFLSIKNWSWEHSIYGHNVLAITEFSNSFGLYLLSATKIILFSQCSRTKGGKKKLKPQNADIYIYIYICVYVYILIYLLVGMGREKIDLEIKELG